MTMHVAPHPKSDINLKALHLKRKKLKGFNKVAKDVSRATRTVCDTLGTVMDGS